MIIGIDGNEANVNERTGVHQYSNELLWALYNLIDKNKRKHAVVIYLKNDPLSFLPKEKSWWKYKVIKGGGVWVITKLMPYLLIYPPDVFFTPSHYLPPLMRMPKVCAIHDLGYIEFSGQFRKYDFWQLKYWTAISLIISNCIITFSKSNIKDIVRHYKFASKKLEVVYHGYDKKRFNTNISDSDVRRVKKKFGLTNYLLFLSTLKPSKNIEGLLDAFKLLKTVPQSVISLRGKNRELKTDLVIAGKKGWMYDSIYKKVKELGLNKDVIFTDFVKEEDKPALMKGAMMLLSPSFWEGFGMHVVEAMACGTPSVISNVASLPEVGGKAAIYVDPYDSKSIFEGIRKVITLDKKEYNSLVRLSCEQAGKFSWEKTAKETLAILERVGKHV
jgi:glycosyltransferase involved in cell wall biosynthesis